MTIVTKGNTLAAGFLPVVGRLAASAARAIGV
jgi:hypothetical protein